MNTTIAELIRSDEYWGKVRAAEIDRISILKSRAIDFHIRVQDNPDNTPLFEKQKK